MKTDPTPAPSGSGKPSAPRLEVVISTLLRIGMGSSFVLIAAGTLRSFLAGDAGSTAEATRRLVSPGTGSPVAFHHLLGALAHGDGSAWVTAGLFLLIATPVLRVLVSALVFLRLRDRAYVLICAVVLALLILSFIVGKAG